MESKHFIVVSYEGDSRLVENDVKTLNVVLLLTVLKK